MEKQKLIEYLKNYEFTYDFEEDYNNIHNACVDYMCNSEDCGLIEECFDDIISYDIAEEMAKQQLENGGLVRLYYFMGDANMNNSIFRIDGYGNLTDAHKDDLENIIENVIERLEG